MKKKRNLKSIVNTKGFTLIELLAVIVVLGIILAIAIPKITETIEKSERGAAQVAAQNVIKAMKNCYMSSEVEGNMTNAKIECVNINGKLGKYVDKNTKIKSISITSSDEMEVAIELNGEIAGYRTSLTGSGPINYYTIKGDGTEGVIINGNTLLEGNLGEPYNGTGTDIIIPKGIETISMAFENEGVDSTSITSVILPDGLEILDYAFANNRLKSLILPSSLQSISGLCLQGNDNLVFIKNESNYAYDWESAFGPGYSCTGLTMVDPEYSYLFETGTCINNDRIITIAK